eukprot:gene8788-11172_t
MHQYTFPKSDEAHVILDLMAGLYQYDNKNVWTFVRVENDTLITGFRQTNGWARTRIVYFAMTFSKNLKMYFDFQTAENEKIKIKFAISPVSTEGPTTYMDVDGSSNGSDQNAHTTAGFTNHTSY